MGIKICPKCGGKVSTSRNVCIHCGYEFPMSKKCPDCGEAVDINTKECPGCGYLFNTIKTTETINSKALKNNKLNETETQSVGMNEVIIAPTEYRETENVETNQLENIYEEVHNKSDKVDTILPAINIEEKSFDTNENEAQDKSSFLSEEDAQDIAECPYCRGKDLMAIGTDYYMCFTCKGKFLSTSKFHSYKLSKTNESTNDANSSLMSNSEKNVLDKLDENNHALSEQVQSLELNEVIERTKENNLVVNADTKPKHSHKLIVFKKPLFNCSKKKKWVVACSTIGVLGIIFGILTATVFIPMSKTTIHYGFYPQTRVTDNSIISNLKFSAGSLPTSSNPHKWTSYKWYYLSSNKNDFAWYIDIDTNFDGQNDYRGVYFTNCRPNITSVDVGPSSSTQYKNGYYSNSIYWFQYQPIEWRILRKDSNNYFLMANEILDSMQHSSYSEGEWSSKTDYQGHTENVYQNNYQFSDLRTFLNVDFYSTAFSNLNDQQKIQITSIDNSSSSTLKSSNPYVCGTTYDKIFALSYHEVTSPSYEFDESSKRKLKVSDYAACMGCRLDNENYCGRWWLRSPSAAGSAQAESVTVNGYINSHYLVKDTDFGVVPALNLLK